ncbi:uncharacterized protein ACJ7VT_004748 isoform 2-T2 [Polymixia lowei]
MVPTKIITLLILELCRSEATADLQIIQPHLDRMQTLRSLWDVETDNTDMEISDSHFLGLVHSLLRDPEERKNFFQDVFPEEFGPMYDKAIQTLMWQFLSRLEKLLPTQTLQQVASLFSNTSSVLNECMETVFCPQELKTLLEYQKDLNHLEDNDSYIDDTCILSALCLPPVERVVIVHEQTETDTEGNLEYTVCTEMEVESEEKDICVEGTGNAAECLENQQWFGISSEVKSEGDTGLVMELAEQMKPTEGESDADTANGKAGGTEREEAEKYEEAGTMLIGKNGSVTALHRLAKSTEGNMGRKSGRRGKTKKASTETVFEIQSEEKCQEMDCVVVLERLDMPAPLQSRPVRQNRGLKMKTYLSQRRKMNKTQGSSSSRPKKYPKIQGSTQNDDMDQRKYKIRGRMVNRGKFSQRRMNERPKQQLYSCSVCKRRYKSLSYLQQHKCPNQSLQNLSKWRRSREVKEQEASTVVKETTEEGEQSSIGAPVEVSEDLPSDSTSQDPSYSPSAEKEPSEESVLLSPECDKTMLTGPFLCPHCSIEFKCKQTFRFHLRNICYNEQQVDPEKAEDARQCFKCDECVKAFKCKSALESHKHTHNPLYCEVCMKLVRDSEVLAMHKISHTPFQCNLCDENFPVFKALYKHYIDVHNPSGPFVCSHCPTTLASLKRFIRHEWRHTGHQPFQCPHCPKRFRSYSDLVEHQKKHTKAYPFLCWECGKKFRHSVTLTKHVAREHGSGQPIPEKSPTTFSCSQCRKSFTSKRCLLKHDNFYHKGVRYPCTHCGKGFSGKDALVRHTLIHTGERPFKCDDCGKCFRSPSELKIHSRYHTGERPYKCSVCDKGFVQSCFLTLHMRTHTGERPYVCSECEKGFSSLHGLKRHQKLVHS